MSCVVPRARPAPVIEWTVPDGVYHTATLQTNTVQGDVYWSVRFVYIKVKRGDLTVRCEGSHPELVSLMTASVFVTVQGMMKIECFYY